MIPHDQPLAIGSLLFEGIDQIDLTGPFEVFGRLPNSTVRLYSPDGAPVRDVRGLRLVPDGPSRRRRNSTCSTSPAAPGRRR